MQTVSFQAWTKLMVHYSIDTYKTTRCMHGGFRALESADEILITHKSKAIVRYICEVLFIICCKVVLAYESVDKILLIVPFLEWKVLSSTFLWCCLLCWTRWLWLLTLWMKSGRCYHPNESYWAVFSPGAVFLQVTTRLYSARNDRRFMNP